MDIATALMVLQGINLVQDMVAGPSQYEQELQRGAGIGKDLVPQLQRQAAGLPTVQTQAMQRETQRAVNRLQQSYATSASRQGVGRTAQRAQQGRLQAAGMEAQLQTRGQAMGQAQQALGQLYGASMQGMGQYKAEQGAKKRALYSGIGQLMGKQQLLQQQGVDTTEWNSLIQLIQQILGEVTGGKPALGPAG